MIITPRITPHSPSYPHNRAEHLAALAEVRQHEARVRAHSEGNRPKFEARGQLLPRDRIALLLDRGAPFIELSPLAGLGMHDDDGDKRPQGGGAIAGIGWVANTRVAIYAHDAAIKGGAVPPMGVKKALRIQEIALDNHLPLVTLAESAGANLQYQAELFVEGGRTFANQARLSAAGVPQITVVYGSSTAGGAYVPGLSDYVVMVRGQARVFLAGPPLVRAATGEVCDEEGLGGALMHATLTGLNEYMAEDDVEGTLIARELVGGLGWGEARGLREERPPLSDPDELCGAVPFDYRQPYDPREVLARLLDGSEFEEFKALFGPEIVTGFGEIYGHRVGVIANNGPICPEGAAKAAQLIQLCCQRGTPLLFLQNTTGFMVGAAVEAGGVIKHGAQMIRAVANAPVPKITLMIGGAFGAGHYAMCGRAYDPRFIFSWPSCRLAVMGGQQAGEVFKIIGQQRLAQSGAAPSAASALASASAQLDAVAQGVARQIERESHALFGTARLWDDGIIDPRHSRRVVGEALSICADAARAPLRPSLLGVTRL
jgi:geranyl-CoA carboxylase beta subunit